VSVTLTSGGLTSNSLMLSFAPPTVSMISPLSAPTNGGDTLVLTGANFGLLANGRVYFIRTVPPLPLVECVPAGAGWRHTFIECLIPEGYGANVEVCMARSNS